MNSKQYEILWIDYVNPPPLWTCKVDLGADPSNWFEDAYGSFLYGNLPGTPVALRLFNVRSRIAWRHLPGYTLDPRYTRGLRQYETIYGKVTVPTKRSL